MNTRRALLTAALLAVSLPGCLYTNIRMPMDTDVATTRLGSKMGHAEMQSVLGLIAWGDAGTQAAARDGNLTTVNHLDREVLAILGFVYTKTTTIAYGD